MVSSNKLTPEQKFLQSQINLKNARILQLKRSVSVLDTVTASKIKQLEKEVVELQKQLTAD